MSGLVHPLILLCGLVHPLLVLSSNGAGSAATFGAGGAAICGGAGCAAITFLYVVLWFSATTSPVVLWLSASTYRVVAAWRIDSWCLSRYDPS